MYAILGTNLQTYIIINKQILIYMFSVLSAPIEDM